jgi:large subunit ribosomal protein L4
MKNVIDSLKLSRALFVIEGADNNVILSARNIRNIKTSSPNTINVYDILNYEHFVVTKEAVNRMQEVYV